MEILGYLLAALVGISLGLIGSGGSILTVPILVYIMGVDPILATAYSLFIVGATALVGGIQAAIQQKVDFKTVVIFGLPSIIAVYATRAWLLPIIPQNLFSLYNIQITKPIALMLLFALVMILVSISMILPNNGRVKNAPFKLHYPIILLEGGLVGILTGLVGAGGGFLIIPALVLLAKMPMKRAVGTSLFIIAAKSLIGFLGDLQSKQLINWSLLVPFTLFAIIGILVGILISKKMEGEKLKKGFGWFVLVMGIYIIGKEIFFH